MFVHLCVIPKLDSVWFWFLYLSISFLYNPCLSLFIERVFLSSVQLYKFLELSCDPVVPKLDYV